MLQKNILKATTKMAAELYVMVEENQLLVSQNYKPVTMKKEWIKEFDSYFQICILAEQGGIAGN